MRERDVEGFDASGMPPIRKNTSLREAPRCGARTQPKLGSNANHTSTTIILNRCLTPLRTRAFRILTC